MSVAAARSASAWWYSRKRATTGVRSACSLVSARIPLEVGGGVGRAEQAVELVQPGGKLLEFGAKGRFHQF